MYDSEKPFDQQKSRRVKYSKGNNMKNHRKFLILVICLLSGNFTCFIPSIGANAFSQSSTSKTSSVAGLQPSINASVKKVAVAGATGRTGRLVVEELVRRKVNVVALVRDVKKAKEMLPDPEKSEGSTSSLSIVVCDLGSEDDVCIAVKDCDAAIWCASGFSDVPEISLFEQLKNKILGITLAPRRSIDSIGVPALARAFLNSNENSDPKDVVKKRLPQVIMLSSAGVTRPSWDDEKKKLFPGAADIPIVRLNPFGILDIKKASEEKLRQTGE